MSAGLADVLVEAGKLSPAQLQQATAHAAENGGNVTRSLLQLGMATENDLVEALAMRLGMGFHACEPGTVDPMAASLVSRSIANDLKALPVGFDESGSGLLVAVSDPAQTGVAERMMTVTGMPVTLVLAPKRALQTAIAHLTSDEVDVPAPRPASVAAGVETATAPAHGAADVHPAGSAEPGANGTSPRLEVVEDRSLPRLDSEEESVIDLDELLLTLVDRGGSDLHLTAGIPPSIRVHGEITPLDEFPVCTSAELQKMLYAIMTQKQREQFENELELDMSYSIPGRSRFRVNVFRQRDAIGSVMRVIPFEILPLEDLGIPSQVANFAYLPRGFVLVTGPTGSGKSTTLASVLDLVNRNRAAHIMTVEDPIEFLHNHKKSVVNQREVGTDTFGFSQALKHVLRQDPDVILVGEMRDLETIQIALTAAETGHLVFGTLHTQDAPQSIDRIIDVFPPHQQEQIRVMLAGALQGVVCQTLLKSADGKGRVAACEVMMATSAVRNLIREGKTHQIYSAIQAGAQHGMVAMDQSLATLVKMGRVTYDAALEKANHVNEFNRLAGKG
jgi:twitching motility protein PilT